VAEGGGGGPPRPPRGGPFDGSGAEGAEARIGRGGARPAIEDESHWTFGVLRLARVGDVEHICERLSLRIVKRDRAGRRTVGKSCAAKRDRVLGGRCGRQLVGIGRLVGGLPFVVLVRGGLLVCLGLLRWVRLVLGACALRQEQEGKKHADGQRTTKRTRRLGHVWTPIQALPKAAGKVGATTAGN